MRERPMGVVLGVAKHIVFCDAHDDDILRLRLGMTTSIQSRSAGGLGEALGANSARCESVRPWRPLDVAQGMLCARDF